MPIPANQQALFNLIGADAPKPRTATTWQNDLYTRMISQPVGLALQNDDEAVPDLAQAQEQLNFINHWREGQEDGNEANEALRGLLNNFNNLLHNNIPTSITVNFNNNIKVQIAKSAYQRIVFIEIARVVEQQITAIAETEDNRIQRQQLLTEVRAAADRFSQISLHDQYMARAFAIKEATVGNYPEKAFTWLYRSFPYYLLLQLNYLQQLVRSFPNPNKTIAGNIQDLLWGIPAIMAIPFTTLVGITLYARGLLMHLPNKLIFNPLQQRFRNTPSINIPSVLANFALNITLLVYIPFYIPFVATVFSATFLAYATSALVAGPLLLGASWLMHRFGIQQQLRTEQFPSFSLQEMSAVGISAFAPLISYQATINFFNHFRGHWDRLVAFGPRFEQLVVSNPNNPNAAPELGPEDQREQLYTDCMALFEDFIAEFSIMLGIDNLADTVPELRNRLIDKLRQELRLPGIVHADEQQPEMNQPAPEAAPAERGINHRYLITRLMQLRARLATAQNDVPEAERVAMQAIDANIVPYVNQLQRIDQLPEALRRYANNPNPQPLFQAEEPELNGAGSFGLR